MIYKRKYLYFIKIFLFIFFILNINLDQCHCMSNQEISNLREEVKNLFYHGYDSYMKYAFPADELMPLSCKGRYRDSEPNRGDIDDVLGNFTLTLIDSLDTLVVMNNLSEFEKSVKNVIEHVQFESDIVVSVFETNIRVIGGLLSGHVLADLIKQKFSFYLQSYNNELLELAKDVAFRLLPAFDTETGIPHPRVNLKYGMKSYKIQSVKDTCTACAGTMILEFAALSRLTNISIFEEKARKALDYLWKQRHRSSDLVGSVLNIHNGDWIRREAGVGAGIDSYYEYLLKAYILLGDITYLKRFNLHYEGIMKYISQGPLLIDVHMHRPRTNAKNFMDSLQAFWPGLQVLKGDIIPAIKTHEILYQVSQQHNFLLPEAFNINDFQPYWAQFLIRPEFLESTYFLYQATNDQHYLEVGKQVLYALKKFTMCKCGFATVRDVRTGTQDDRMDSFVLSETLKYLYLLFSKKEDLIIDIDKFIFTTEAHFLPLSLRIKGNKSETLYSHLENIDTKTSKHSICLNLNVNFIQQSINEFFNFKSNKNNKKLLKNNNYYKDVRSSLKNYINYSNYNKIRFEEFNVQTFRSVDLHHYGNSFANDICLTDKDSSKKLDETKFQMNLQLRLEPENFIAYNPEHVKLLKQMGINTVVMEDGRVKLIHLMSSAETVSDGQEGVLFMQKLIQITKNQFLSKISLIVVKFKSPFTGKEVKLPAGTAKFGVDLSGPNQLKFSGQLSIVIPFHACNQTEIFINDLAGKIAVVERGDCIFVQKVRKIEKMGAIACIVIDNVKGSSAYSSPLFTMSGDSENDIKIPVVFLYYKEGEQLAKAFASNFNLIVHITNIIAVDDVFSGINFLDNQDENQGKKFDELSKKNKPIDEDNKLKENFGFNVNIHNSQINENRKNKEKNESLKINENTNNEKKVDLENLKKDKIDKNTLKKVNFDETKVNEFQSENIEIDNVKFEENIIEKVGVEKSQNISGEVQIDSKIDFSKTQDGQVEDKKEMNENEIQFEDFNSILNKKILRLEKLNDLLVEINIFLEIEFFFKDEIDIKNLVKKKLDFFNFKLDDGNFSTGFNKIILSINNDLNKIKSSIEALKLVYDKISKKNAINKKKNYKDFSDQISNGLNKFKNSYDIIKKRIKKISYSFP